MTAANRLGRGLVHAWAVVFGYFWRECPGCHEWFGGQERGTTNHFETIPGGEDDQRMICPKCTDAGVGCRAHAEDPDRPAHHDGCEHVLDHDWPADDTDIAPGRSGPYSLKGAAERDPTPYPRETDEPVQAIKTVIIEPVPNTHAQRRRFREAAERARTIAEHRELMRAIPECDSNRTLRQLLSEHAPAIDPADTSRLICSGCQPSEPLTTEHHYEARAAAAPCPTWLTIYRLHRRTA